MTINERINSIMIKTGNNYSSFSRKINVKQNSVSQIIKGSYKPSFDFLEKLLNSFPIVNAEWLITGKGEMFKPEIKEIAGLLVETTAKNDNDNEFIQSLKEIIETQKGLIQSLQEQIRLYKIIDNAKK